MIAVNESTLGSVIILIAMAALVVAIAVSFVPTLLNVAYLLGRIAS